MFTNFIYFCPLNFCKSISVCSLLISVVICPAINDSVWTVKIIFYWKLNWNPFIPSISIHFHNKLIFLLYVYKTTYVYKWQNQTAKKFNQTALPFAIEKNNRTLQNQTYRKPGSFFDRSHTSMVFIIGLLQSKTSFSKSWW